MTTYRIAVNHDVILGALQVVKPQPRSTGVQPTRRTFTGASYVDEGLFVEWVWEGGIADADEYQDLLILLGVYDQPYRDVTIYTRDERFEWNRYNGVAIRPTPVWENYFPRLVLLIRDLQDI